MLQDTTEVMKNYHYDLLIICMDSNASSAMLTLTFGSRLNVIRFDHFTGSMCGFRPYVVTVFSTMVYVYVSVLGLWTDLTKFLPTVSANLLAF